VYDLIGKLKNQRLS